MNAPNGVGSRGGNVRSLDQARDLQAQQKDKRDWAGAIDEQIARTLHATGYFHADDLDTLGVPPEHCNLKGTRTASFRNRELMEKSGAERKVSHAAANRRKAPIYRITEKGRAVIGSMLVGVGASSEREPGVHGPGNPTASVDSGETPVVHQEASEPGVDLPASGSSSEPEQVGMLPEADPESWAA